MSVDGRERAGGDATAEAEAGATRAALVATTAAAVIGLVGSLVRAKAAAHFLGREGVGTSASIQQVVATLLIPITVLSGPALMAAFARAAADDGAFRRVRDAAASFAGALWLGLSVVAVVASGILLADAGWQTVGIIALLVTVAVGADAAVRIGGMALLGAGRTTRYAALGAAAGAIVTLGGAIGASFGTVRGLWIGTAGATLLAGSLAWLVAGRALPAFRARPRWILDRAFFRVVLSVGGTSFIAGLSSQIVLSIVRLGLFEHGGMTANGEFQAAWALTGAVGGVWLQGIGNVINPKLAISEDGPAAAALAAESARIVLLSVPGASLVFIALRSVLVPTAYSSEFALAINGFGMLAASDVARAYAASCANALLYTGRVRAYLAAECVAASLLCGAAVLGALWYGAQGACLGMSFGAVLFAVAEAIIVSRALGSSTHLKALPAVVAIVAALLVMEHYTRGASVGWLLVVAGIGALWSSRSPILRSMASGIRNRFRGAKPR